MESKSREKFEAWFSDNGKHPKAIERDALGYKLAAAENQWQAWKQSWRESRSALVVELPEGASTSHNPAYLETHPAQGFNLALIKCTAAIRAAGITVKGEGDEANANDS